MLARNDIQTKPQLNYILHCSGRRTQGELIVAGRVRLNQKENDRDKAGNVSQRVDFAGEPKAS